MSGCLVIGGARRLGAAVALELAGRGYDVAVSSRTPAAASEVIAAIEGRGRSGVAVGGDVTARIDAQHLVASAASAIGRLDLVVFAASGPFAPTPPEELGEDDWDRSLDVVARGFLFVAQAARGVFLRQAERDPSPARGHTGTIVALTDIVEGDPWPRLTPHFAAKAAEIMLVRLLASAWAADGVRVCGVAPGPVDIPDDPHRDATERAASRLGYPRLLRPGEIATAVVHCTTDAELSGTNRTVTAD